MKTLFNKVYIERQLIGDSRVRGILGKLGEVGDEVAVIPIDNYESLFSQHKPYRSKDAGLQSLILAEKRGETVKIAPPGYGMPCSRLGLAKRPEEAAAAADSHVHFYFVHAYNCIYSCTYCYLQGYFPSPDLVLFVNHEKILSDIEKQISVCAEEGKTAHFHSGEFSDSLALAHLTGEVPMYFDFFKKYPNATLELRTKSANFSSLVELEPLANVIISLSLSPRNVQRAYDKKTASLSGRLKVLAKLTKRGFRVAIHLDPIIYTSTMVGDYTTLAKEMREALGGGQELLEHISLGALRFSDLSLRHLRENYPFSSLLGDQWEGIRSSTGKYSYPYPLRRWLLEKIEKVLVVAGFSASRIYTAMEEEEKI